MFIKRIGNIQLNCQSHSGTWKSLYEQIYYIYFAQMAPLLISLLLNFKMVKWLEFTMVIHWILNACIYNLQLLLEILSQIDYDALKCKPTSFFHVACHYSIITGLLLLYKWTDGFLSLIKYNSYNIKGYRSMDYVNIINFCFVSITFMKIALNEEKLLLYAAIDR